MALGTRQQVKIWKTAQPTNQPFFYDHVYVGVFIIIIILQIQTLVQA